MLLGTVLQDEVCAQLIADSGIIPCLVDLLKAKQEDDEIVLQASGRLALLRLAMPTSFYVLVLLSLCSSHFRLSPNLFPVALCKDT